MRARKKSSIQPHLQSFIQSSCNLSIDCDPTLFISPKLYFECQQRGLDNSAILEKYLSGKNSRTALVCLKTLKCISFLFEQLSEDDCCNAILEKIEGKYREQDQETDGRGELEEIKQQIVREKIREQGVRGDGNEWLWTKLKRIVQQIRENAYSNVELEFSAAVLAARLHSKFSSNALKSFSTASHQNSDNSSQDLFCNLFDIKTLIEKFISVCKLIKYETSNISLKICNMLGLSSEAEYMTLLCSFNPKLFFLNYNFLDLICDNCHLIYCYPFKYDEEECVTFLPSLLSIIQSDYKLVLQWEKSTVPFLILYLSLLHYNLYYKSDKKEEVMTISIEISVIEDNIIALCMAMDKIFMIETITLLDLYKLIFLPLQNYRLCSLLFFTVIRNREMYNQSMISQISLDETAIRSTDCKSKTRFDYETHFVISKLLDLNKAKAKGIQYGEQELKAFLKEDDLFVVDQLLSITSRKQLKYCLKFMQEVFSETDVKSEPLLKPVISDDEQ